MRTAALVFLPALALSAPVLADIYLYKDGSKGLSAALEVGAYYGHVSNANFGSGVIDFRTGATGKARPDIFEAYLEPTLGFHSTVDGGGEIHARLSAVAALTRLDGDAGGFTRGEEQAVDLEAAVLGWRSGDTFPALGRNAIDISAGPQEFRIGDQFLMGDGNIEAFDDAVYWLGPRDAFRNSVILRTNTAPVRGDAFYLRADTENDRAKFAGANLELQDGRWGSVGALFMHGLDATNATFRRDGMDVADARFVLNRTGMEGLSLSGEWVEQFGESRGTDIAARAWHLTLRYDVPGHPWQPFLRYRYARFSGDDLSTARQEGYDSLFYGYSEYDDWFQGELAGNLFLFNGNQRNHMVQASVSPAEWLRIDAFYWRFDLDRRHFASTPVSSRHFGDEINLALQIFPAGNIWFGAFYSLLLPGDAARQAFGRSKAMHAIEFFVTAYF